MKRFVLWIVAIVCFLASGYAVLGLLMVALFSAGPQYSPERSQLKANLWGSGAIIFFTLGLVFTIIIWRIHRRHLQGNGSRSRRQS